MPKTLGNLILYDNEESSSIYYKKRCSKKIVIHSFQRDFKFRNFIVDPSNKIGNSIL